MIIHFSHQHLATRLWLPLMSSSSSVPIRFDSIQFAVIDSAAAWLGSISVQALQIHLC